MVDLVPSPPNGANGGTIRRLGKRLFVFPGKVAGEIQALEGFLELEALDARRRLNPQWQGGTLDSMIDSGEGWRVLAWADGV